jgi:lysophospholipase L1-like esterase
MGTITQALPGPAVYSGSPTQQLTTDRAVLRLRNDAQIDFVFTGSTLKAQFTYVYINGNTPSTGTVAVSIDGGAAGNVTVLGSYSPTTLYSGTDALHTCSIQLVGCVSCDLDATYGFNVTSAGAASFAAPTQAPVSGSPVFVRLTNAAGALSTAVTAQTFVNYDGFTLNGLMDVLTQQPGGSDTELWFCNPDEQVSFYSNATSIYAWMKGTYPALNLVQDGATLVGQYTEGVPFANHQYVKLNNLSTLDGATHLYQLYNSNTNNGAQFQLAYLLAVGGSILTASKPQGHGQFLLALGDSITAGSQFVQASVYDTHLAFPFLVSKKFGMGLYNRGYPGRHVQAGTDTGFLVGDNAAVNSGNQSNAGYMINNALSLSPAPTAVVLLLGINDSGNTYNASSGYTLANMTTQFQDMITLLMTGLPLAKFYVPQVLPVDPSAGASSGDYLGLPALQTAINSGIAAAVAAHPGFASRLKYNFSIATGPGGTFTGVIDSSPSANTPGKTMDGLHPNMASNAMIATNLEAQMSFGVSPLVFGGLPPTLFVELVGVNTSIRF